LHQGHGVKWGITTLVCSLVNRSRHHEQPRLLLRHGIAEVHRKVANSSLLGMATVVYSDTKTAMALLDKAVTMGYRDPGAYRTESALDPLRNRPDFQLLMMDLVLPARPFAE